MAILSWAAKMVHVRYILLRGHTDIRTTLATAIREHLVDPVAGALRDRLGCLHRGCRVGWSGVEIVLL